MTIAQSRSSLTIPPIVPTREITFILNGIQYIDHNSCKDGCGTSFGEVQDKCYDSRQGPLEVL